MRFLQMGRHSWQNVENSSFDIPFIMVFNNSTTYKNSKTWYKGAYCILSNILAKYCNSVNRYNILLQISANCYPISIVYCSFNLNIQNLYILFLFLVKEDTLLDMVCAMTDNVALVHQMPFTCDRNNFPSVMEKVC